jgi:hypothetical protein
MSLYGVFFVPLVRPSYDLVSSFRWHVSLYLGEQSGRTGTQARYPASLCSIGSSIRDRGHNAG